MMSRPCVPPLVVVFVALPLRPLEKEPNSDGGDGDGVSGCGCGGDGVSGCGCGGDGVSGCGCGGDGVSGCGGGDGVSGCGCGGDGVSGCGGGDPLPFVLATDGGQDPSRPRKEGRRARGAGEQ